MATIKAILTFILIIIATIACVVAGYYLGLMIGVVLFGGVVVLSVGLAIAFLIFIIWDSRNTRRKRPKK